MELVCVVFELWFRDVCFQKHIVRLGKGKTVKGKAAVLLVCKVQEWAYLFQNHKGFQETYIALQKQGHEFPPPSKELMVEQSRANERRLEKKKMHPPAPVTEGQRRLRDQLVLLQENVGLVIEMMGAIDPAVEQVQRHELVGPLLESIGQQRPKLAELIGRENDEDTTGLLLAINDDINAAFGYYAMLCSGQRPHIPKKEDEEEASVSSPAPRMAQVVPEASPAQVPAPEDPFAALAKARHAKQRTSGVASSPAPSSNSSGGGLDLLFASPAPPTVVTHVPQTYHSSADAVMQPTSLSSDLLFSSPSVYAPAQPPPGYTPPIYSQYASQAPLYSSQPPAPLYGSSGGYVPSPAPPVSGAPALANPYQNPFLDPSPSPGVGNNNNAGYYGQL